jgi:hypothetical protein
MGVAGRRPDLANRKEQEPSERGDRGATVHRDRGLPFRHLYFRLGESTWLMSADSIGSELGMIRTPYAYNRSTHRVENLFV